MTFEYFQFEPFSLHTFLALFSSRYNLELEQATTIYDDWREDYDTRAFIFYGSQYKRHASMAWKDFCNAQHISEDERCLDHQLKYLWKEYQTSAGIDDHYAMYQSLRERYERSQTPPMTLAEMVDSVLNRKYVRPREKEVDETWFNQTIHSSPDEIHQLRSLPYPQYLSSRHWRKVKAALMLLHRARCQEKEHFLMGESWYGDDWESDLHAHHLHYKNKGNERYKDVVLLCNQHHKKWHENDARGVPNIEIVYSG